MLGLYSVCGLHRISVEDVDVETQDAEFFCLKQLHGAQEVKAMRLC